MGNGMTCHTTPKTMVRQGVASTLKRGATPPPPPYGGGGWWWGGTPLPPGGGANSTLWPTGLPFLSSQHENPKSEQMK